MLKAKNGRQWHRNKSSNIYKKQRPYAQRIWNYIQIINTNRIGDLLHVRIQILYVPYNVYQVLQSTHQQRHQVVHQWQEIITTIGHVYHLWDKLIPTLHRLKCPWWITISHQCITTTIVSYLLFSFHYYSLTLEIRVVLLQFPNTHQIWVNQVVIRLQ